MKPVIFVLSFFLTFNSYAASGSRDVAALLGAWQAIEARSNSEPPPEGMLEPVTMVGKRSANRARIGSARESGQSFTL